MEAIQLSFLNTFFNVKDYSPMHYGSGSTSVLFIILETNEHENVFWFRFIVSKEEQAIKNARKFLNNLANLLNYGMITPKRAQEEVFRYGKKINKNVGIGLSCTSALTQHGKVQWDNKSYK